MGKKKISDEIDVQIINWRDEENGPIDEIYVESSQEVDAGDPVVSFRRLIFVSYHK